MAKGPQIEKEIRDEIEHVEKLTLVYFLFFFFTVFADSLMSVLLNVPLFPMFCVLFPYFLGRTLKM